MGARLPDKPEPRVARQANSRAPGMHVSNRCRLRVSVPSIAQKHPNILSLNVRSLTIAGQNNWLAGVNAHSGFLACAPLAASNPLVLLVACDDVSPPHGCVLPADLRGAILLGHIDRPLFFVAGPVGWTGVPSSKLRFLNCFCHRRLV